MKRRSLAIVGLLIISTAATTFLLWNSPAGTPQSSARVLAEIRALYSEREMWARDVYSQDKDFMSVAKLLDQQPQELTDANSLARFDQIQEALSAFIGKKISADSLEFRKLEKIEERIRKLPPRAVDASPI